MLADDSDAKIRAHEPRRRKRRVPYMLIAPEHPQKIRCIALDVYSRDYGSHLALLRSPNLSGRGRLVNAAKDSSHGELLSYLLFAEAFIERLIEVGREDTER